MLQRRRAFYNKKLGCGKEWMISSYSYTLMLYLFMPIFCTICNGMFLLSTFCHCSSLQTKKSHLTDKTKTIFYLKLLKISKISRRKKFTLYKINHSYHNGKWWFDDLKKNQVNAKQCYYTYIVSTSDRTSENLSHPLTHTTIDTLKNFSFTTFISLWLSFICVTIWLIFIILTGLLTPQERKPYLFIFPFYFQHLA